MEAAAQKEKEERILRIYELRSNAVRQAMTEFIGENRVEILKRAKAKLVAMGLSPEEANPGQELPDESA